MIQQTSPILVQVITNIQNIITKNIPEFKYVDEDWGQLDYYSPNFPVKFPCVLIDVTEAQFENLAIDTNLVPKNRQTANLRVSLTIADQRLTNTSSRASQFQKTSARSIHNSIEKIHQFLHGQKGHDTGVLIRESMNRVKRDDGVQEYNVVYRLAITNI